MSILHHIYFFINAFLCETLLRKWGHSLLTLQRACRVLCSLRIWHEEKAGLFLCFLTYKASFIPELQPACPKRKENLVNMQTSMRADSPQDREKLKVKYLIPLAQTSLPYIERCFNKARLCNNLKLLEILRHDPFTARQRSAMETSNNVVFFIWLCSVVCFVACNLSLWQ